MTDLQRNPGPPESRHVKTCRKRQARRRLGWEATLLQDVRRWLKDSVEQKNISANPPVQPTRLGVVGPAAMPDATHPGDCLEDCHDGRARNPGEDAGCNDLGPCSYLDRLIHGLARLA